VPASPPPRYQGLLAIQKARARFMSETVVEKLMEAGDSLLRTTEIL